jgi:hypothetical protein
MLHSSNTSLRPLRNFNVPERERGDLMAFISSIESDIVER